MRQKYLFLGLSVAAALGSLPGPTIAQSMGSYGFPAGLEVGDSPRVNRNINDQELSTVRNTHPKIIEGVSPLDALSPSVPMHHMQLVLKRSIKRESALEHFITQQHDPASPHFHHWLTPAQYGESFGVAESDISAATSWLVAEGFTVNNVYPNRMQIDFSGNVGLVNRAFRTHENHYRLGNVSYFANSTDISIPSALQTVVSGVAGLNDLHTETPALTVSSHRDPSANKGLAISYGGYLAFVPNDLATIYGVAPLRANGVTGKGITIAIVGNADMVPADWTNFTQVFNLARFGGSFQQSHPSPSSGTTNCTDPASGLPQPQDDTKTLVSAEWATALAPGANIVVASCADVAGEPWLGTIIAATNLINGSTRPDIISLSTAQDEQWDAAGKTTIDQMWQQADAEGISVFAAVGDKGTKPQSFSSFSPTGGPGIGVNAFATSPHVTAVGGTDFSAGYDGTLSNYFLPTPSVVGGSAIAYVPEIPWNESCGNGVFGKDHGYNRAVDFCNDMIRGLTDAQEYQPDASDWASNGSFLTFRASSGGPSSVDAKPSWQGIVNNAAGDGRRDVPDVALFAGSINESYWLMACSQSYPCSPDFSNSLTPYSSTALSSAMFAGIQAVIDQGLNDRNLGKDQGNAAPTLYALAEGEYGNATGKAPATLASCASDNTTSSASNCIFHNITRGSTSTNCVIPASNGASSPNCYFFNNWTVEYVGGAGSATPVTLMVGLTTTDVSPTAYTVQNKAYTASTGWSFASGLGSVNAKNLLIAWRAYNSARGSSSTH